MKKTILLLDDDEEEYDLIKMAVEMTEMEFRCTWANGLEKATQMLREDIPDFIFIDINMPKHNGILCLEHLQKMEQLRHSTFIIYSTYISDTDREKALQMGAHCMPKPESISALRKLLLGFFRRSVS